MTPQIHPTDLPTIQPLRDRFRQEMNCQITKDSIHIRPGWTREYLIRLGDGQPAGYGSIAVAGPWKDKPTLYEFYLRPEHRRRAFDCFTSLVTVTGVAAIETQSNEPMLTVMLHSFGKDIRAEAIVYHDRITTTHPAPAGATFRTATAADGLDVHPEQLPAHGVVEIAGEIVASGGILFHYNPPYGDIYMDVREPFRRRGVGAYLVQELKRVCRELRKIPAARCNVDNVASRKTLQKAGFVPCGNLLAATLPPMTGDSGQ